MNVVVSNVKGCKRGALAGKDAVEKDFDEVGGSRLCANIARVFDVLACDCDASAVGV